MNFCFRRLISFPPHTHTKHNVDFAHLTLLCIFSNINIGCKKLPLESEIISRISFTLCQQFWGCCNWHTRRMRLNWLGRGIMHFLLVDVKDFCNFEKYLVTLIVAHLWSILLFSRQEISHIFLADFLDFCCFSAFEWEVKDRHPYLCWESLLGFKDIN